MVARVFLPMREKKVSGPPAEAAGSRPAGAGVEGPSSPGRSQRVRVQPGAGDLFLDETNGLTVYGAVAATAVAVHFLDPGALATRLAASVEADTGRALRLNGKSMTCFLLMSTGVFKM